MIKIIKAVVFTLLFIFGITLAMNNTDEVVLNYYFGLETPPIPIFLLVLFSIFLGVLVAGAGFMFDVWSLKRALRDKERKIASLERELLPSHERERRLVG